MADADDRFLDACLAAARERAPALRPELLSAILADAAAATRRRPWYDVRGNWRAAAALAAAAVFGFWIGIGTDLVADPTYSAAADGADPVAAFFDLASAEN